jgi:deoxycytidylate deaminase
MYQAYSAGLNSGCMSRQVGAVVTNKEGHILGMGWNDVPKFGGGVYREGPQGQLPDHRCLNRDRRCANDSEKEEIALDVARHLGEAMPELKSLVPRIADAVLSSKCRLKDLIEFSRAVHAEMMAIINSGARQDGGGLVGGKLYVTTYPCHACARHIITAGISEVIYIEPYRKSLATKLHSDAWVEETESTTQVCVRPFEGVGPTRYADFFEMPEQGRKDKTGMLISTNARDVLFSAATSLQSYPTLEALVVERLGKRGLVKIEKQPQTKPAS